jgi:hypothetical protein
MHPYTHTSEHTHTHTHRCIHTHTCISTQTGMYLYANRHTHTNTHAYTHTHTHTCGHINVDQMLSNNHTLICTCTRMQLQQHQRTTLSELYTTPNILTHICPGVQTGTQCREIEQRARDKRQKQIIV